MKPVSSRRSLYEPLAEINVTPLVDVMLVLLIVFMITAPMLAAGMKVDLPQAQAAEPLDPQEPVVLTVQKDGRIFFGREEVAPDALVAALRARLSGDGERTIHLRGDREVAYGEIVTLMDRLAASGFVKVALLANSRRDLAPLESAPKAAH